MGLLKEELRRLGSLIIRCADATAVPAGGALAVDRHGFARMVTESVQSHPNITVVPGEVTEIPAGGGRHRLRPADVRHPRGEAAAALGRKGRDAAFLRRRRPSCEL